jgi:hypothetical protein
MHRGEAGSTIAHAAAYGDSSRGDESAAVPTTTSASTNHGTIGYRNYAGPPGSDTNAGKINASAGNAHFRTDRDFSAASRLAGRVG